jgi:hypothetical protein
MRSDMQSDPSISAEKARMVVARVRELSLLRGRLHLSRPVIAAPFFWICVSAIRVDCI